MLTPPIIVAQGANVMIFATAREVEEHLEPREVAGDAYRAWDGTGRSLRLDLGDAVCLEMAPISVSLASAQGQATHDLTGTLRELLARRHLSPSATASIRELVDLTIQTVGYTE